MPDYKLYQELLKDLHNMAQLNCNKSGPDADAAARLEPFASANTKMVHPTRTVFIYRVQQLKIEIY